MGVKDRNQETKKVAREYFDAGLIPIPIAADGSKRPIPKYGKYRKQEVPYGEKAFEEIFSDNARNLYGIAILTGPVSGNLEALDVDDPSIVADFESKIPPEIFEKLVIHGSPRGDAGGRHYLYRCDAVGYGKAPIARHKVTTVVDGVSVEEIKARIETTLYLIVPGSPPETHPSGKPYRAIKGDLCKDLQVLTIAERDQLRQIAASYHDLPVEEAKIKTDRKPSKALRRIGDVFNRKGTWEEVLEPHGYEYVKTVDGIQHWCRPGDDKTGTETSLTTGLTSSAGNDVMVCFSTSTVFDAWAMDGKGRTTSGVYNKFNAYTRLNFGPLNEAENFSKAAAKLADEGYETELLDNRVVAQLFAGDDEDPNLDFLKVGNDWYEWDGTRYVNGNSEELQYGDSRVRTALYEFIDELRESDPESEEVINFRSNVRQRDNIKHVVNELGSLPQIRVNRLRFDRKPDLINVQNGTITLKDGKIEFGKHCREHYLTKIMPVRYMPDAKCETFDRFLDRFCESTTRERAEAKRSFLQQLAGLSLTGHTTRRVIAVLTGSGGNGKSLFFNTMRQILGPYAHTCDAGNFKDGKFAKHTHFIRSMEGARMLIADEFPTGLVDTTLLKSLSGGTVLRANAMRTDSVEFAPEHTLWIGSNGVPRSDGDPAYWDRVKIFHCESKIAPDEGAELAKGIAAESVGILNWALEGLLNVDLFGGLYIPEEIRDDSQIEAVSGEFYRFVHSYVERAPGSHVVAADMLAAYHSYQLAAGDTRPVSAKAFSRLMQRYSFEQGRKQQRYWKDVALKSPDLF